MSLFFLAWSLFVRTDTVLTSVAGWAGLISGAFAVGTAGAEILGMVAMPLPLPGARAAHRARPTAG